MEREVVPANGAYNCLAKLEGGLVLLGECVIPLDNQQRAKEVKAYTFLCVKEGNACIQFANVDKTGESISLEQPTLVEIYDNDADGENELFSQNSETQHVSKICCVNAGGFVQEFRVFMEKWR